MKKIRCAIYTRKSAEEGLALCANILETIRSLKLVSRAEEDHR